MNANYKEILQWIRDAVPAAIQLEPVEDIEEWNKLDDATQLAHTIIRKAGDLLNPTISSCDEELLLVLQELHRIAPEQGWHSESNSGVKMLTDPGYLAATSGCTEVRVEVEKCSLSKRTRYKWTVVTIGPGDYAHDAPPPSVDEVFSSSNPLAIARRAAAEDYLATIQYA